MTDQAHDETLAALARDKKVDLVFEGGAVWGTALVGALCVLEEQGYRPQNIAGTSAGAIVASLVAAGYSGSDIRDVMFRQNFSALADPTWEARIPVIGVPLSVVRHLGIHKGDVVLGLLRKHLAAKGVRTFKDLVHPEYADQPTYRYRLQVIASNITDRRLLVLPRDAAVLGVAPDDLEVALAVRMSMSIPLFFKPIHQRNKSARRTVLVTDGSMLSNFPVWLFDSGGVPEWPTFGLRLVEDDPRSELISELPPAQHKRGISGLIEFAKSLLHTMMDAHDRMYLETDTFVRTITIPTMGVPSTDFYLTPETLNKLYESGRNAAQEFLATWSFEDYIAEFRSGRKAPDRRVETGVLMRENAKARSSQSLKVPPSSPPTSPPSSAG
jgi:NTE family protein